MCWHDEYQLGRWKAVMQRAVELLPPQQLVKGQKHIHTLWVLHFHSIMSLGQVMLLLLGAAVTLSVCLARGADILVPLWTFARGLFGRVHKARGNCSLSLVWKNLTGLPWSQPQYIWDELEHWLWARPYHPTSRSTVMQLWRNGNRIPPVRYPVFHKPSEKSVGFYIKCLRF